jgi:hypothetical protein
VDAVKRDAPKHPTLRFLGENRDFFRAQMDLLRMRLRDDWDGTAMDLDPRWLAWRDMLARMGAASDSAAASAEWLRRRELMESVGELVALELEMDEMEGLLTEQEARLIRLEDDFVGTQQTALVVLLTGAASGATPSGVTLRDPDGVTSRIELTERVRDSMARGGSAELFHRLVEPRAHGLEVQLEGPGFEAMDLTVAVEPQRHRITFLEIDLSHLEATPTGPRPAARWWVR